MPVAALIVVGSVVLPGPEDLVLGALLAKKGWFFVGDSKVLRKGTTQSAQAVSEQEAKALLAEYKAAKASRTLKTVVENREVAGVIRKMTKEQQAAYEQVVNLLASGQAGRNQHALKGNLQGLSAIDLPGSGGGRGNMRVIYRFVDENTIEIVRIGDYH